eukprot:tig00000241_g20971.t1
MLLVGLTGGIATGKSSVSTYFKERGVPVVDADYIAREVVKAGSPALQEIEQEFGHGVILSNGELNREALGKIIFGDSAKKRRLEHITHPRIQRGILQRIFQYYWAGCPVVVLDVPLLLTSPLRHLVKVIVVVDVDEETQRKRLLARDGARIGKTPEEAEEEARKRIASQVPRDQRLRAADVVIDNSGSLEDTRAAARRWLDAATGSDGPCRAEMSAALWPFRAVRARSWWLSAALWLAFAACAPLRLFLGTPEDVAAHFAASHRPKP